VDFTEVGNGLY